MSDTSTENGEVVVNRLMSLDGFIAGPGDAMDWAADRHLADLTASQAAATGAMLVGRRTDEVGKKDGGREAGQHGLPVLRARVRPHP